MSKNHKEVCPKCGWAVFAKATDGSNRHYCGSCRGVWIPGSSDTKGLELQLKESKALVQEQLIEISRLRKKVEELTVAHKPEVEAIFE